MGSLYVVNSRSNRFCSGNNYLPRLGVTKVMVDKNDHIEIATIARNAYGERMGAAKPGTVEYYRLWGDYRYYDGMTVGLKVSNIEVKSLLMLILDLEHGEMSAFEFVKKAREAING